MGSGKGKVRRTQTFRTRAEDIFDAQAPTSRECEKVIDLLAEILAANAKVKFNDYYLNNAFAATVSDKKIRAVIAPLVARKKLRQYRELLCPEDWNIIELIEEEDVADLLSSNVSVECDVCGQKHLITKGSFGDTKHGAGEAYVHGEDLSAYAKPAENKLRDLKPVIF